MLMMNRVFSIMAVAYILGILVLPRLIPETAMVRIWNPYSLLHVPLYGALMVLLTFAFLPRLVDSKPFSFRPFSLLLPGGIASLVGILDEVNQASIPHRDASITDVFLDVAGIFLAALSISYWQKRKKSNRGLKKTGQPETMQSPVL
ncbi:MAG: VanZ family protein [Thermodesulfobacteriota bacterium]|nr:VanZ family protein [Thermodesulfobacteriota bacterium]